MLKSILGKSKRQRHQQQHHVVTDGLDECGEEDGFILIGQTASDRTTVNPGDHGNPVDAPPSYDLVSRIFL